MTKEAIKLSIESDLLEKAKKSIPNMSRFVEDCLKQYLGEAPGTYPVADLQDLLNTIGKCQLQIQLTNERNKIEENIEKARIDEIQLAWRRAYAAYRDTRTMDPLLLQLACEKLEVPEEQLRTIILMVFAFRDELTIDITDWFQVFEEYGDEDD